MSLTLKSSEKQKSKISNISLTMKSSEKHKSKSSNMSLKIKTSSGKMTTKTQEPAKSEEKKQKVEPPKTRNYLPEGVLLLNMKVPPILRPNPNWEEDLENSTIIDDKMRERIKSYSQLVKKPAKDPCTCHIEIPSGVAAWWKMNDGRKIPSFGLGTWPGFHKTQKHKKVRGSEVREAIEVAIVIGYRHFDTAFIYGTEKQLGKAVNKKINEGVVRRKDLFITTKVWNDKHRKEDVVATLKTSLKLMNLTYVDLYLIHWPVALDAQGNLSEVDYLDTWQGMIEAQVQALTNSIGVCNFNQSQLSRIITCTSVKPACLQIELNLNLQQPRLLSFCRQHDILVVGYRPFGSVFDLDTYPRPPPPHADDPFLNELAAKYNKSIAQVMLRYILELGALPIAKWATKDYMMENFQVYNFKLTQDEKDRLKKFDRNYRTISAEQWIDSPDYPF